MVTGAGVLKLMPDKDAVIKIICETFGANHYPGDDYLQGSFDGTEPYDEIEPFKGQSDWQTVDSALLDAHYAALSFFSEAGLRFFLPAYLVADLRDELQTADPLFVLTHGFRDIAIEHQTKAGRFVRKTGKSALINPQRYGAMTFYDYARWRLSVFTREEAQAIVAYLKYKRNADPHKLHQKEIDAALDLFWLNRAKNAPPAESLNRHLQAEADYRSQLRNED